MTKHQAVVADRVEPENWVRPGIVIAALVVVSIAFKLLFLPPATNMPYSLIMTPGISQSISRALAEDWTRLLLPHEYEVGRFYWPPTVVYAMYFLEKGLGPVGTYITLSSLFVLVTFVLAQVMTRSLVFSSTIAFLFAFGTQLNYQFTYGNLVAFYLILSYGAVNFTIAAALISGRVSGWGWRALFAATLVIFALSNEMWINYATAIITATFFGIVWATRHRLSAIRSESIFLLAATLVVLALYLFVRMRWVHQYLAPGAEEELLVTYRHRLLMIDDFITNFMTLLYLTLSNYLPSFLSSSNSLVYLQDGRILSGQNGYHPEFSHLVVASHLFQWRFYAGILTAIFAALVIERTFRAWRSPSAINAAIFVALALMIVAGFSTHLSIKMRPYNVVPALPYKAIISISLFTVLLAFVCHRAWQALPTQAARLSFVGIVWGSAFVAALTRPFMQSRLLKDVSLVGAGDPLGQILRWLQ
ncbi:hypothetical protein FG93_04280 [Bosea sp. LC85]|uniref:hypothetical protein n=1 Tax=Bosea sp. LC85 TaxID=1502851 RepID=UPI0004E42192|nr:hypothetical protein [Bosea sp. LC85]KFC66800.1 hypothetical protein FG93_04280 [Bosea sp. LC85]